ncbi:MAG: disulfide bond formation protein DsbA [Ilumatobacteraceae bacterium]|nr:disulfide bond formation protein DsbA [Ilumatobacteraceae bacterium]
MSPVTFYFDPACPWTWITARWVVDVSAQRGFGITWLPFSLRYRNRDNPGYDRIRDELDAQHPGMRVIEAARQQYGNDAVGRLYTAFGTLIHHDRDDNLTRLAEGIAMAKLPPVLIDSATDDSFDAAIEASTEAGLAIVGDDAGIPIVVIEGASTTFFGPVMSPAPIGAEAVELWDAFVTLGKFDGLYEIKRTRSVGPLFGPRP